MKYMIAAIAMFVSSSAYCQWGLRKGQDNPFIGGAEHVAVAGEQSGIQLVFRCTNSKNLVVVLLTNYTPDLMSLTRMKQERMSMTVVIDSKDPIDLFASIETTEDGLYYMVTSIDIDNANVLHGAAFAKKRIAVAAKIGLGPSGKVVWSEAFAATGAYSALYPLIDGCKIKN